MMYVNLLLITVSYFYFLSLFVSFINLLYSVKSVRGTLFFRLFSLGSLLFSLFLLGHSAFEIFGNVFPSFSKLALAFVLVLSLLFAGYTFDFISNKKFFLSERVKEFVSRFKVVFWILFTLPFLILLVSFVTDKVPFLYSVLAGELVLLLSLVFSYYIYVKREIPFHFFVFLVSVFFLLMFCLFLPIVSLSGEGAIKFVPFVLVPMVIYSYSLVSPLSPVASSSSKHFLKVFSLVLFSVPLIYIFIAFSFLPFVTLVQFLVISLPLVVVYLVFIWYFRKKLWTFVSNYLSSYIRRGISFVDENVFLMSIGEFLEKVQEKISKFFGYSVLEAYNYDSLKKELRLSLIIDNYEGLVEKFKVLRISSADVDKMVLTPRPYFRGELSVFKELDADVIIPIALGEELKMIVSVYFSFEFCDSCHESVTKWGEKGFSISKFFLDSYYHYILLISDFLLSKVSKESGCTALISIDDVEIRQELTASLILNGFDVYFVGTYEDGIRFINSGAPDVLIVDDVVDGSKVVNLIKYIKSNPSMSSVYTILAFYDFSSNKSYEFFESFADTYILLKSDLLHLNNITNHIFYTLRNRKELEKTYRTINYLMNYSKAFVDKILAYKSLEFESVMESIIDNVFLESRDIRNVPDFLILGSINNTVMKGKAYSLIGGERLLILEDFTFDSFFYKRKQFGPNKVLYADYRYENLPVHEFSKLFSNEILGLVGEVSNFLAVSTGDVFVLALNYKEKINSWDIDLLKFVLVSSSLIRTVYDEVREVDNAFVYTMQSLARAAEEMDEETGAHIYRVGEYSKLVSSFMGFDTEFAEQIYYSSQMHDIGKLRIPREILRKPGPLTPEEYEVMKEHTIAGAIILGDHPKLSMARDIALGHHERWDGSGYPYGKKGIEIPVSARITMLADIYDALRSPRTYKPPFEHERVVKIILEGDGRTIPSHFDPAILEAFRQIHDKFNEIYEKYENTYLEEEKARTST